MPTQPYSTLSNLLLQVFIEPLHSLEERLLFRELVRLDAQIRPDGKAMHHTTEQIDLVLLTGLGQDRFGLMTLRGREDLIGFCKVSLRTASLAQEWARGMLTSGGNTQRALDSLHLIRVHETGMRDESSVKLARLQISHNMLGPKTVPHPTEPLDAHAPSHLLDHDVHDRIDSARLVSRWALEPLHHVEARGESSIDLDRRGKGRA